MRSRQTATAAKIDQPEVPDLEVLRERAREAVRQMQQAAMAAGLDKMTDDPIDAVIDGVRTDLHARR